MIRRPLTSIELKLDDLQEYTSKKEQSSTQEPILSFQKWNPNVKPSTKEIHDRIGLTQQNTNANKRTNT